MSESVHPLLERQLRGYFPAGFRVPEAWQEFIAAVSRSYRAFEERQKDLERPAASATTVEGRDRDGPCATVNAIPDLLIRLDAEGAVLECKAGVAFDRTTTETESVVPIADAHVGEDFRAAAVRALTAQEMVTIEYALGRDEHAHHYEARLVPAGTQQVVAFVRDITGRKRTEEEWFKSREMIRKVLDTIPQRVFWKDRNSVYLGANRPLAQDCGFRDPADLVGKTDFDTLAAGNANLYRRDDEQVMLNDRPKLDYEEPQQRADGARRWLRTSKAPLHDREGRVIGVLGSYEDITERKNAEILRAGQNRILEMIVAGASLHETLTRLTLLMESLSAGLLCMVLLTDGEGKRLRSFVAPSLAPEFAAAVDGMAVGENSGVCGRAAARRRLVIVHDVQEDPEWVDFRELTKRFDVRAVWSAPILSHGTTVLGTFAMYYRQPRTPNAEEQQFIDIAAHIAGIAIQRKAAEDALRTAEEKYRNIFEHAIDGIFQIAPEGRVLEANPAFARMFGYDSPAALVAQVHDVAQELCAEPERYVEFARALEARGVVQRWELAMRDREQRVFWVSIDARLARAADGQTLCYEGIAEDVTERKRLERQFLQAQKMEAFGQLAGGVAHDFNNLLTVILGNLSLIRLGGMTPRVEQAAIEDCFRSAQRAANLTGQLLTFSRRQPIEPRDLDLNEIVRNLSSLLQRLIGEHIALETRCTPEGARVRADAGMMEQVLMNLALNSRDAMPQGGTLLIATTAADLDGLTAQASIRGRPGSFVRLSVTDTGTGIAPEHLAHIFEPFFTTKEVGKGTGLGLATVFGIVEQHDGWIDVDSTPDRGTTMHVYLPRLMNSPETVARARAAELPRRGTETILLAEDEADVRALMSKLLERHGYRVFTAGTGAEALALWEEHRGEFDLLVTDMVMPGGIGGRELGERLMEKKPGLRVLYCSGYSDEMLGRDWSMRIQASFLEKPFDVHEFLERVRACLDAPA